MKKFLPFVLLLFFFLFPPLVSARVVINEVYPKEEWVELYNIDDNEASLEGCVLYMHKDKYKTQSIEFSASDSVSKFKLIKKGEYNWSTNWLKDEEDTVFLECPLNTDSVSYGGGASIDSPGDKSIGRNPDGTGGFSVLSSSTPGELNSSPPTPSPTPSPTPTPTPTPTKTPTPTPTKTPTPLPSSGQVKPTSMPIITSEPTISDTGTPETFVLGMENKAGEDEASESAKEKKVFSLLPVLFIVAGLVCIGTALFLVFRKGRAYNEKSEENS